MNCFYNAVSNFYCRGQCYTNFSISYIFIQSYCNSRNFIKSYLFKIWHFICNNLKYFHLAQLISRMIYNKIQLHYCYKYILLFIFKLFSYICNIFYLINIRLFNFISCLCCINWSRYYYHHSISDLIINHVFLM